MGLYSTLVRNSTEFKPINREEKFFREFFAEKVVPER
jgi:hypothetical protein